jgi:hypothetical protein
MEHGQTTQPFFAHCSSFPRFEYTKRWEWSFTANTSYGECQQNYEDTPNIGVKVFMRVTQRLVDRNRIFSYPSWNFILRLAISGLHVAKSDKSARKTVDNSSTKWSNLLGISWSPGYLRSSSFLTWSRKESTLLFAIIDIWVISVNLSTYPSPWLQHNFHCVCNNLRSSEKICEFPIR